MRIRFLLTQRRKYAKVKAENEIAKISVDVVYHIHRRVRAGLLELVYDVILAHALNSGGLE